MRRRGLLQTCGRAFMQTWGPAFAGSLAGSMAFSTFVFAQAPDFSGTWKLDKDRSQITPAANLASLIPSGAPETLHITQPANGTLMIESQINEGHSRLYMPGGKTTAPVGQTGTITMATRWEGRSLVSEGTQDTMAGTTTTTRAVKEVIALSADGKTLTIEVTNTAAGEKSASSLAYTRITDVGPCATWPTPCKAPAPPKTVGRSP